MKKNIEKNDRLGRKYVNILGINVLVTRLDRVLSGVEGKIADSRKFSILTPNPELIVMSQDNSELKQALNKADFSIPDGIGLAYASKYLYERSLKIIPGRKLFDGLIELAAKRGWKVFLLGGLNNEAELAAKKLKRQYASLKILSEKGPKLDSRGKAETEINRKLEKDAIDRINRYSPQLLFVAFKNPKQEVWIHKNLPRLKVGGAMAVGGVFRYVAGLSSLPSGWMEKMGLEWLWRLINEPFRIGRIWNAVVVFPWKVFIYKILGGV